MSSTSHTRSGTPRSISSVSPTLAARLRSAALSSRSAPASRPNRYAPTGRLSRKRNRKLLSSIFHSKRSESRKPETRSAKPLSALTRRLTAHHSRPSAAALMTSDHPTVSAFGFSRFSPPRRRERVQPTVRRRRKKCLNGNTTKPSSASSGSKCPLSPSSSASERESAHHTAKMWRNRGALL